MGAGQSKTVSKIDYENIFSNEIDANTRQRIQENCISSTSQSNVLNIVASDVTNLTTDQKNISTNLCILQTMLENTTSIDTVSDIANKLINEMESKGGNLLGGSSETNSTVDVYNEIKNKIDASQLAEVFRDCILQQDQENIITIMGSSVRDSSFTQLNENIGECMTKHEYTADLGIKTTAKTDTAVDQMLKSIGGSMDLGASLSSLIPSIIIVSIIGALMIGGGNPYIISFLVLVLVIIGVVFYMNSQNK